MDILGIWLKEQSLINVLYNKVFNIAKIQSMMDFNMGLLPWLIILSRENLLVVLLFNIN